MGGTDRNASDTLSASQTAVGRAPVESRSAAAQEAPPDVGPGDCLGRYTIKALIGAGGMGRVFSALDNELGRTVALKLIRPDQTASPDAHARLLREAQTLAHLHHPNVVTVHDVDSHGDKVFVAMELIEGPTLHEWVRSTERGWRAIRDAFLEAGRGLAAAHAVGIVHRDFKPHNAIVGAERVVVVDFGLARAAADAPTSPRPQPAVDTLSVGLTHTGERVGTPRYMAPEQRAGSAVTAKADQFAFCVALHEALWGQLPGEPGPPPAGAPVPRFLHVAIARGLSPRPEDRWPSMSALLAALAPKLWTPRMTRLVGAAAAVAIAAVAVLAFTVGRRAAEPERCVGAGELVAPLWNAAAQARVRTAFLRTHRPYADGTFARVDSILRQRLAGWADAHHEACAATQLRHEQSEALLDLRMACLHQARSEIAAVVSLLGEADSGTLDRAVQAAASVGDVAPCADRTALGDAVPPPREPARAHEVNELRLELAHLTALQKLGKVKEGMQAGQALLPRARSAGYAPVLAQALYLSGWFEGTYGNADVALDLYYRAAQAGAEAKDDAMVASALSSVEYTLGYVKQKFEAADVAYHSALAAAARAGNPPRLLVWIDSHHGDTLHAKPDDAAALPFYVAATGLCLALYGAESYQLAQALLDVADVERALGHSDAARPLYERARAIAETALGAEHPVVLAVLNNFGISRLAVHDLDMAATLYERVLAIKERVYGPDTPGVAITAHNLAIVRFEQRHLPEARGLVERAIRIRTATLGSEHPLVATDHGVLAGVARLEGKSPEALAEVEKALAIQRKAEGGVGMSVAVGARDKADLLLSLGRRAEARAAIDEAMAADAKGLAPDDPERAPTLGVHARVLAAEGRAREAIPVYERALALFDKNADSDAEVIVETGLGLSAALVEIGDAARAVTAAERALAVATDRHQPADIAGAAQFRLAQARWAVGADRAGAVTLGRDARARLASLPYPVEILPEIDRWLARVGH